MKANDFNNELCSVVNNFFWVLNLKYNIKYKIDKALSIN